MAVLYFTVLAADFRLAPHPSNHASGLSPVLAWEHGFDLSHVKQVGISGDQAVYVFSEARGEVETVVVGEGIAL